MKDKTNSLDTPQGVLEHSLKFLEMAFRTDRQERMDRPDGYGRRTGDCGDTVEIFLQVTDGTIRRITFWIQGCLNTLACANTVAQLTEGRPVTEAWEITPQAVAAYLETLPSDHFHCAELAVGAFYLALSNYQEVLRSPWKKFYKS